MESKPRFLEGVKTALEDRDRRWGVYYFASMFAASAVQAIDLAVIGSQPEQSVGAHPWLRPLDRCFAFWTPLFAIALVGLWLVFLWKLARSKDVVHKVWFLVFLLNLSPLGWIKVSLRRSPWAVELASYLQETLLIPVFPLLLAGAVYGFNRIRVQGKREIDAYKARRAPKPRDVATLEETVPGGA
jgi:hypothetical protein